MDISMLRFTTACQYISQNNGQLKKNFLKKDIPPIRCWGKGKKEVTIKFSNAYNRESTDNKD